MDKLQIQSPPIFNIKDIIIRNPRLETVMLVEQFIKDNNGKFKKTNLFHTLPKKIMWGTFNVILNYLYENNKIGFDKRGYIVYIWNPELIKTLLNKQRY